MTVEYRVAWEWGDGIPDFEPAYSLRHAAELVATRLPHKARIQSRVVTEEWADIPTPSDQSDAMQVGLSTKLPSTGLEGGYSVFPCTVSHEGATIRVSCDATWKIRITGNHWFCLLQNTKVHAWQVVRIDDGYLHAQDTLTCRGWSGEWHP
jgi:hypothetical protein